MQLEVPAGHLRNWIPCLRDVGELLAISELGPHLQNGATICNARGG